MVELNQPGTIISDKEAQTVLIQYRDSTGTLYWQKYYFVQGSNQISNGKDVLGTSEFLKVYSEAADTVRYVYERTR